MTRPTSRWIQRWAGSSATAEWAGGSKAAFGSYPKDSETQIWGYGLVNLLIFGAGLGLVALGAYVATRRRTKVATLNLESVHS